MPSLGQNVGVTQVGARMWLVTFMHYDLGYFDDETCRLEPIENPFGPKVLPMCPEWTHTRWRPQTATRHLRLSGTIERREPVGFD